MGQSPETSLRLDGESDEAEVSDEAGAGAAAKISRSSLIFISGNRNVLAIGWAIQRRETLAGIGDAQGL